MRIIGRWFCGLALLSAAGCNLLRVDIVGDAMSPTLKNGDRAIATRRVDRINRGDVVAFRYPRDESKSFVMRVVALPGEEIEMKDGGVIIGGRPLDETYVAAANRSSESWGPKAIPDDEYERLVDSESLSRSEVVEGVEVHLSVETVDVRKDGDLRICMDASVSGARRETAAQRAGATLL